MISNKKTIGKILHENIPYSIDTTNLFIYCIELTFQKGGWKSKHSHSKVCCSSAPTLDRVSTYFTICMNKKQL